MSKTYFLPLSSSAAPVTRRDFVNRSLIASAIAAASAPPLLRGQNLNNKVDIAVVGAGGKGATDTDECAKGGANIVALCDVDSKTLDARLAKYPGAKGYRDYRKLYAEMGKSFDAVIVSTPDHIHAPAASLAMKMGKHAYVQKPSRTRSPRHGTCACSRRRKRSSRRWATRAAPLMVCAARSK